jgi:spoIIIJ-associated protein
MDAPKIIAGIQELIQKLGLSVERITEVQQHGNTVFNIETKDSGILIGTHGDTLSALNQIIKRIYEDPKAPEHFSIDINGYHAKEIRSLEDQARVVAERAKTFKYDIDMAPMSSYQRMIVHSILKEIPNIDTTSVGEGAMRHIVVRYVDPTALQTETPIEGV